MFIGGSGGFSSVFFGCFIIIITHYLTLNSTQLVNLFMIWPELLSREFLNWTTCPRCVLKIKLKNFFFRETFPSFRNQIKVEESSRFHAGTIWRMSGFCRSSHFLSWVTQRPFVRSRFFFVSGSATLSAFLLPLRECFRWGTCCRQEAFCSNKTLSLAALSMVTRISRRQKNVISIISLLLLSVCLPFPMLESR